MSVFSGAMAGAGEAIAGQARGLIDAETKVNVAKELAKVEEERQMRLLEAQETRRREGAAYDFEQAGKNQPEVLRREDLAGTAKGARETNLALGRKAAEADAARRELPADAAAAVDPRVLAATQAGTDAKVPTSTKKMHDAQAKLYGEGGAGAAAARVRAGGTKGDDEKTAQATVDRYLKTAKALEDSGDVESARVLREKAQLTLAGIEERQAGKGKGAAAKTYPPAPAAAIKKLEGNASLRGDFDLKYGPGSAALILGD